MDSNLGWVKTDSTKSHQFWTVLMAKEIERKFLVMANDWKKMPKDRPKAQIIQGYLSGGIRVRVKSGTAYLTIKENTANPRVRYEFEYEIPYVDGVALMKLAGKRGTIINKTRYFKKSVEGYVWEIDVFGGDLTGLVMAEIETPKANTKVELPAWVGKEVTSIKKYSNSSLFHNGLQL